MKKEYDLIIFGGAPGSGKSTVLEIINKKLENVWIDFGKLREFHLDKYWKKANSKEELMAFENLVFIINNYMKNKYHNIAIDDLLYDKAIKLTKIFSNKKILFLALVVEDTELARRVSNPRDSGFNNVRRALEYNRQWKSSDIKRIIKLDNSHNDPNQTAKKIIKIIQDG